MQENTARTTQSTYYWVGEARDQDGLSNLKNALACMEQAESVAQETYDWITVAETWERTFHDSRKALRCLEFAESLAEDTLDWTFVAGVYERTFHNSDKALQCMERAESLTEDGSDWASMAATWAGPLAFGDLNKALQCMERAESMAESKFEWESILEAWRDLEDNDSDEEGSSEVLTELQDKAHNARMKVRLLS